MKPLHGADPEFASWVKGINISARANGNALEALVETTKSRQFTSGVLLVLRGDVMDDGYRGFGPSLVLMQVDHTLLFSLR